MSTFLYYLWVILVSFFFGAIQGSDSPAPSVQFIGGAGFDATNVLATATNAGVRGVVGGFTFAFIVKIDTQVSGGTLFYALQAGVNGFQLRQPTATTVTFEVGNGTARDTSSPYYPAANLGEVVLLVGTTDDEYVNLWANDALVGRSVATLGTYSVPAASMRNVVGATDAGGSPHTGMTAYGWGGWNRTLTDDEIHGLYDTVRTTGVIPTGIADEVVVCNVSTDTVGTTFPAIVTDAVASNDFSFISGSEAGIDFSATSDPVAWAGVDPNPAQMDVWFGLGESHMVGRGNLADAEPGYEPGASLLMLKNIEDGWETLVEPTGNDPAITSSNGVGPLGLFGWEVLKETGRVTGIVNAGQGGSRSSDWGVGGVFWAEAMDMIQVALSRRNTKFRGFLTMIGTNEAATTPVNLAANWTVIMASYREYLGTQAVNRPEIMIDQSTTTPGPGAPYPGWAAMLADIDSYVASSTNVLLVAEQDNGPYVDGIHYTTAANQIFADRALVAAMSHYSWEVDNTDIQLTASHVRDWRASDYASGIVCGISGVKLLPSAALATTPLAVLGGAAAVEMRSARYLAANDASSNYSHLHNGDGGIVIAVFVPRTSNFGAIWGTGDFTPSGVGASAVFFDSPDFLTFVVTDGDTSRLINSQPTTTPAINGTAIVHEAGYTEGETPEYVNYRDKTVLLDSGASAHAPLAPPTPNGTFRVGSLPTVGWEGDFDLAHVMVFDARLTAGERNEVYATINSLYGLSL